MPSNQISSSKDDFRTEPALDLKHSFQVESSYDNR